MGPGGEEREGHDDEADRESLDESRGERSQDVPVPQGKAALRRGVGGLDGQGRGIKKRSRQGHDRGERSPDKERQPRAFAHQNSAQTGSEGDREHHRTSGHTHGPARPDERFVGGGAREEQRRRTKVGGAFDGSQQENERGGERQ